MKQLSIDYETEGIIQKSIDELLKGSTILTIAHRIKTIIKYDKILCINQGKIEDFDSPDNLLKKKNGIFYELYINSNI